MSTQPTARRAVASGESDSTLLLPGMVVTETRRLARTVISSHAHEHTNIGLCLGGTFEETVGGRPLTVTPATVICRPAGELHANRYGSEMARCVIIELLPPTVGALRSATDVLDRAVVQQSAFAAVTAARIHRELGWGDSLAPLAIESLVHELIVHVTRNDDREHARRPAWLDQVVDLLHEGMSRTFSLSAIADAVGVHPSHLTRTFRKHYGCTVGAYLRELRLAAAARLLAEEGRTLAQLAAGLGFADQSHFTNAFTRRFGMSPGQFRCNRSS